MRMYHIICIILFVISLSAFSATILRVQNGQNEQIQSILAQSLTESQAKAFAKSQLVEIEKNGKAIAVVPAFLNNSSEQPELIFMMPGITPPNTIRRFIFVQKKRTKETKFKSDLKVNKTSDGKFITVHNSYFQVQHPVKGGGGLPINIKFQNSEQFDKGLYLFERIFRRKPKGQYILKDDPNSTAKIIFQSPLRVIIESTGHYIKRGRFAPGNARAKYQFIYTPHSPVVRVRIVAEKDDDTLWDEMHFLHLTRNDYFYNKFIISDKPYEFPMQKLGVKSVSYGASSWGGMVNSKNVVGVGGGSIKCWDASSNFYYYVSLRRTCWKKRRLEKNGLLYFGPTLKDHKAYDAWLNKFNIPIVSISESNLKGAYTLTNKALQISFANAENGFDCVGILNRLGNNGGVRFVHNRKAVPGLWKIVFRRLKNIPKSKLLKLVDTFSDGKAGQPLASSPYDYWVYPSVKPTPESEKNKPYETFTLDNRASGDLQVSKNKKGMTFFWKNLDLGDEKDVVDVTVTVNIAPDFGQSEWRIFVTNRSKKFGVYETYFPTLSSVNRRGFGDVLIPSGNWGGKLCKGGKIWGMTGLLNLPYPGGACPVQLLSFINDGCGLYFAAHDSGARTKRILLSPEQDATFAVLAENAGQPGVGQKSKIPFVVTAYKGDWWEAARLYRKWATRQEWCRKGWIEQRSDVSGKLKDLECWWLATYYPKHIESVMSRAEKACGKNIGLQWYKWHKIPFDNSYPEYFPTKPGVSEAIHRLTAKGLLIMPYINGRLWDSQISSFTVAGFAGSCKKYYGGNYTEIYHKGGRKLAPMCPTTKIWQDTMFEICHKLVYECGVNGIYIDQISAARPRPCYDPVHGHPLGGGRHWVDGYRTMLNRIKADISKVGCILSSENCAEPYMDNIDVFLTWSLRRQEGVPLLPAIYSGYTLYYGSPQVPEDTLEAFALMQGRDFTFGCQLGWNRQWLLDKKQRSKLDFMLAASKLRIAAKKFMVFGQLVDKIRPLKKVPPMTVSWNRRKPYTLTLPSAQGTIWRSRTGEEMAVAMFNASGEKRELNYSIEPGEWLSKKSVDWIIKRLKPTGKAITDAKVKGLKIIRKEILAPYEVRIITITPEK